MQMSEENVYSFMKRYGESARSACPDVSRVYTPSVSLFAKHASVSDGDSCFIQDFLGHSNINTTSIYASTDITMMKNALEKISKKDVAGNIEIPAWQGNEDMILTLCGLK
jgi:site-specific recombinase XerC